MAMAKILGISGSPRKGGNSDVLLKSFLGGASQAGVSGEHVRLSEYQFQSCIGCEKCRKTNRCEGLQDGMQILYPKILEAKGIILVSPTHNYNVTAWMKAFIDRLYCFYGYTNDRPRNWWSVLAGQGRKAVLGVIGEQADPQEAIGLTLTAMKLPIEALGYDVIGELPVVGVFDKGIIRNDQDCLEKARQMGYELAQSIK
jgi:multimeric flavodoxin WrbA